MKTFKQLSKELQRVAEDKQIDELSKSTLGKYVKKSADSMASAAGRVSDKMTTSKDRDASIDKLYNRRKGIEKATNRLTKEESDQIDELSQNTLRQYHGKAAADYKDKKNQASTGTLSTSGLKTAQKRRTGLDRAANKMD